MDLRTMSDKAVTSENAFPTTTSVRIPHRCPTSAESNRTLRAARIFPPGRDSHYSQGERPGRPLSPKADFVEERTGSTRPWSSSL